MTGHGDEWQSGVRPGGPGGPGGAGLQGGWTPSGQVPSATPPPGSSHGTNLAIGLGVVVVVALVIAIVVVLAGGDDDPAETATDGSTTTEEGATTTEGTDTTVPVGNTISAFDLADGNCWNQPEGDTVEEVEVVHCSLPHDLEVYAVWELEGDGAFSQETVSQQAADGCRGDRFTDFVGITYQSSRYFTNELFPTEGSWGNGDREVVCSVFEADGEGEPTPVEGSMEGISQ